MHLPTVHSLLFVKRIPSAMIANRDNTSMMQRRNPQKSPRHQSAQIRQRSRDNRKRDLNSNQDINRRAKVSRTPFALPNERNLHQRNNTHHKPESENTNKPQPLPHAQPR